MKTTDYTPTWSSILPIYLSVLQNPDANFAARKDAIDELERMARLADEYVKRQKEQG